MLHIAAIGIAAKRRLHAEQRGGGEAQGVEDKLVVLRERTGELGVALKDTAYVGNDINDAECLRAVGVPVVPADAWPEVKPLARWVLSRAGGAGCVREFCDAVWEAQRS